MLKFLVTSQQGRSSGFKHFRFSLFYFLEDFTIVSTLIQSLSASEYALSGHRRFASSDIPNALVFQMTSSFVKAQQDQYIYNCMRSRHMSRMSRNDWRSEFSSFLYRTHEFCVANMGRWRRDHRVKVCEMGEILIAIMDPLAVGFCL